MHSSAVPNGWTPEVVRFATRAYIGRVLRPKDIRLANVADIETATGWMKVSAPKGLGRWASGGDLILITDEVRPAVLGFLDWWERHLRTLGLDPKTAGPLVPNVDGHYYTDS